MKQIIKFALFIIFLVFLLSFFAMYKIFNFDYKSLKSEVNNLKNEIKIITEETNLEIGEIFFSTKLLSNKNKDEFILKKHFLPFKHYYANGLKSMGYVQLINDKIIFTNSTGEFYYFNNNDLEKNKINFFKIENNLRDVIKDDLFYSTKATYSIKDIEIFNNELFVSYTKYIKHYCYNTSILKSELNFSKLEFEEFFSYDDCIDKSKAKEYLSHLAGGKMQAYKNGILFSIGDYQQRNLGQVDNVLFGKIVFIDIKNKTHEIFSKGHRNPQGLLYLKDEDIILETEHGPVGGDEVNKIKKDFNYGWPISSYGKLPSGNFESNGRNDPKPFESHKDHGFEEPLKYYLPSVGISQLIYVPKDFNNKENNILVASMGRKKSKPYVYKAIFDLKFNEDYSKVIEEDEIVIGERIRDLIYVKSKNLIVLVLENSPSLAVLKRIN